jgi:hypothetical protein
MSFFIFKLHFSVLDLNVFPKFLDKNIYLNRLFLKIILKTKTILFYAVIFNEIAKMFNLLESEIKKKCSLQYLKLMAAFTRKTK